MKDRTYIVHVGVMGVVTVLYVYAATCNPLGVSELTQFLRSVYNPACYVQSFVIEPDPIPQIREPLAIRNNASSFATASHATTSTVPSPSMEAPGWE